MIRNLRFTVIVALAWLVTACEGGGQAGDPARSTADAQGAFERLDPAFDFLVPPDAVVEKVAGGFEFTEGPVWVPGDPGALLFSDIPANTVYRWTEADGTEVYLHPVMPDDADTGAVGGSNGLALDPEGRLVLCEHGNRRVARLEEDGSRSVLADRYGGRRLNSPNDIVFHSSGAAFFTDPPYGLVGQSRSPAREQDHNGVYRLDADGSLTLVADGQTRPNGIGLSPDQRTLYVANSADPPGHLWMVYPVRDDLSLGEGEVFFDANEIDRPGWADGMTLDESGNIYATGPGGVLVFAPNGRHLGTIPVDEIPTNVGWGDDGKTLYITAQTSVYRIRLGARGLVYSGG